jgi:hypothetical protein
MGGKEALADLHTGKHGNYKNQGLKVSCTQSN